MKTLKKKNISVLICYEAELIVSKTPHNISDDRMPLSMFYSMITYLRSEMLSNRHTHTHTHTHKHKHKHKHKQKHKQKTHTQRTTTVALIQMYTYTCARRQQ